MSAKQDRQGVRTAKDLEQKYNFGQSFSEVQKSIKVATNTAEQAEKVARKAESEILQLSDSISMTVDNGASTAQIILKVGDREIPATIDMKGLVTFSNLANADGTTVINGSNITTGQILADLIKAGILASNDGSVRFDLDNNILEFIGDPWSTAPEGTRSRCVLKNDSGGFSLWSQSAGGVLGLSISATNTGASIGIWKDEAGVAGMRLLSNGKGGIYASQVSVWDAPTVSTDAVNKAYVDSALQGKLDTSAIDATWGRSAHVIDVSSYDSTYYYPLLIPIPNWIKTRLALIVSLDTNVPSWATHSSGFSCNIDVSLTRSGCGAQTCSYTKWHDDWRFADKKPAWFGGFVYTSNLAVFYVRGGGIYRMYSDDRDIPQPTIVNPSYTDPSGTIYVPVTSQVDYWIGNNFDLDTIETNVKGNVEGNAIYAPNSSQLFSSDSQYAYDGVAPYYGHLTYESPYWRFKVYPETPANVIVSRSDTSAYADRADNAGNADRASVVTGVYTGSGGAHPPSYVGSNVVRFNMMNRPSGLSAHEYCDYLLMDTYEGGDVPYVTAIGVAKTSVPKAYIAVGQKGNTSTWIEEAEIITTKNACCFDSGSVSTTYLQDSGSGANFYVVHVYVSGYGYTSIVIDKAQMNTSTYRYYYVHGGGYVGAYKSSNTVAFITDGSSPATTINHIRGYI